MLPRRTPNPGRKRRIWPVGTRCGPIEIAGARDFLRVSAVDPVPAWRRFRAGLTSARQTWDVIIVGEQEPCDWCGRPGRVRQHDYWRSGVLVCRNPSLCDVCEFLRDLPGDVEDAIDDADLDYDAVQLALEAELERKWREKVASGKRAPQGADEAPGLSLEIDDR
jgi:hypothetical protein